MAYYAMERLRHTLTPQIEYETRRWDKSYHYLNHYFNQTTPTECQMPRDTFSQTKPITAHNTAVIPPENLCMSQEQFKPLNTEYNGLNTANSETFNSSTFQNCYRTIKKIKNTYHIPNYAGYIPGMKTQNPFAKTFTKASKEEIEHFDNRRSNRNYDIQLSKKWNYDPLSKTYGEFAKTENNFHASRLQRTIINHPYSLRVRTTSYGNGGDWKTPEVYNKKMFQTGKNFYQPDTKDYTFSLPKFCKTTTTLNQ